MTKGEAIALQATVNDVLALAVERRSTIGGAVNWADLRCVDVQVSMLDGVVTVSTSFAIPP